MDTVVWARPISSHAHLHWRPGTRGWHDEAAAGVLLRYRLHFANSGLAPLNLEVGLRLRGLERVWFSLPCLTCDGVHKATVARLATCECGMTRVGDNNLRASLLTRGQRAHEDTYVEPLLLASGVNPLDAVLGVEVINDVFEAIVRARARMPKPNVSHRDLEELSEHAHGRTARAIGLGLERWAKTMDTLLPQELAAMGSNP